MNTKHCTECGKTKSVEDFHRKRASRDGLQSKCKTCFKKINKNFRETNPKYQLDWQRQNPERHVQIVAKFRKADKTSKIYYIKSPNNQYYIGMTNMHLAVRFLEHKNKYNRWMKGKSVPQHPNLFESFKQLGVDNHHMGILFESDNMDRKGLRQIEKAFIKSFMDLGIALNKQI